MTWIRCSQNWTHCRTLKSLVDPVKQRWSLAFQWWCSIWRISHMQWMSIHLECASTIMRNIFPVKGPTWSTCIWGQGRPGHSQGCKGEQCGSFLVALAGDTASNLFFQTFVHILTCPLFPGGVLWPGIPPRDSQHVHLIPLSPRKIMLQSFFFLKDLGKHWITSCPQLHLSGVYWAGIDGL